jgi:hypothetical protein
VVRELAAKFLALAEKQGGTVPLMIGHRVMGLSLLCAGDMAEGRAHYDQAIALYDPAAHRPLAARFGVDIGVAILSYRSLTLWTLGYPDSALVDAEHALGDAREIGQAATILFALGGAGPWIVILCGNYAAATVQAGELVALAVEKGAAQWKPIGILNQGLLLVLTGSLGRCPNDELRDRRISVNGINNVDAVALVIFSECLRGTRSIRRRLALH